MSSLQLVSELTNTEIAKNRATEALWYSARELAANVLRVVAGAGDCVELHLPNFSVRGSRVGMRPCRGANCRDFPRVGMDEPQPLGVASREDRIRWLVDGGADQIGALKDLTNGALRLAASGLMQQLTQACAAETKLRAGARDLVDA